MLLINLINICRYTPECHYFTVLNWSTLTFIPRSDGEMTVHKFSQREFYSILAILSFGNITLYVRFMLAITWH